MYVCMYIYEDLELYLGIGDLATDDGSIYVYMYIYGYVDGWIYWLCVSVCLYVYMYVGM
jgi:hypothetical protein